MANVIVDEYGNKRYYDDKGDLHREDGPAIVMVDGSCEWYNDGWYNGRRTMNGLVTYYPNGSEMHRSFPNGLQKVFNGMRNQWPVL